MAKAKENGRIVVAVQTDKHGGHILGLLNPDTVLKAEDRNGQLQNWTPKLQPTQEALWEWYTEDVKRVKELAGGDPIVLVDLGDQVQGGNGRAHELVSTRMADQIAIGAANLAPWFKLPNLQRALFVKGTGYHEMGEGSAAMLIGEIVAAKYGKQVDVPYHSKAVIGGVNFDLSHHGAPPGSRNWLRGNVLRLYVQSLMDRCLMEGQEPPDVLLRGHYHQYVPETVTRQARGKTYRTRAAICPSYCFIDDYARKVAKSPDRITIGMVAFEVEAEKCGDPVEIMRTLDFATNEVLA